MQDFWNKYLKVKRAKPQKMENGGVKIISDYISLRGVGEAFEHENIKFLNEKKTTNTKTICSQVFDSSEYV